MKISLIPLVVAFFLFNRVSAQGVLEQYAYLKKNETLRWVPVVRYKGKRNWYTEARYNYEEENTFSLYVGKMFSKENNLVYSITPMLGGVVGKFKGGSLGLNLALDYKDFFFSSQSQYTFTTAKDESLDFLFSWSELAYQPFGWFYFGLSAQHTYFNMIKTTCIESGILVGFEIGKWSFPMYVFNLKKTERYFVVGINLDMGNRIVKK